MTATAHAIVAGAIAASIHNPSTAYPLAFFSHFFMDAIPHWDFGTNWRMRKKSTTGIIAIADTVLGFTVAYLLFGGKVSLLPLLICVALGNLPDWLEAPYYIFFAKRGEKHSVQNAGFLEKLSYRIYKTENMFHTKAGFPFGVLTQIATVGYFLFLTRP